jgi:hypothetical protein
MQQNFITASQETSRFTENGNCSSSHQVRYRIRLAVQRPIEFFAEEEEEEDDDDADRFVHTTSYVLGRRDTAAVLTVRRKGRTARIEHRPPPMEMLHLLCSGRHAAVPALLLSLRAAATPFPPRRVLPACAGARGCRRPAMLHGPTAWPRSTVGCWTSSRLTPATAARQRVAGRASTRDPQFSPIPHTARTSRRRRIPGFQQVAAATRCANIFPMMISYFIKLCNYVEADWCLCD